MLATAKIHILKQFTTTYDPSASWHELCLLLQRYTFWSNSQLPSRGYQQRSHCACYCKDTHFEAIHNYSCSPRFTLGIVLATAKIHILKQFTTIHRWPSKAAALCLLLQRYTFWSNSQLTVLNLYLLQDCACYCKDTHFEAIHNMVFFLLVKSIIVLATAKIHILKQFTTATLGNMGCRTLCLLLQRYTFWSNSQPGRACWNRQSDCACYCKDTHFEAIHNSIDVERKQDGIVLATAKIHILKQFTTVDDADLRDGRLCLLLQRYTFWSNSQLVASALRMMLHCACYCKDTHFEAIHNPGGVDDARLHIVLATAKIHILKQFTTHDAAACVPSVIVLATAKIHILKQFTTQSSE